jgi:hypothetical protein
LFFFPTHIPFGYKESREFWQHQDDRQWTKCGRRKWNYICHRTAAKCWMLVIADGEYLYWTASAVHRAITQSSAQIFTFSPSVILYLGTILCNSRYISNWEVRVPSKRKYRKLFGCIIKKLSTPRRDVCVCIQHFEIFRLFSY